VNLHNESLYLGTLSDEGGVVLKTAAVSRVCEIRQINDLCMASSGEHLLYSEMAPEGPINHELPMIKIKHAPHRTILAP
jgi:hypothetical protein